MPESKPAEGSETKAGRKRRGPRAAALLLMLAVAMAAVALFWPGDDRQALSEWLVGSAPIDSNSELGSLDIQPSSVPGWDRTFEQKERSEVPSETTEETTEETRESSEPAPATSTTETTERSIAASQPTRIVIPAIGVNSRVVPVGLLESGAMEVPDFGLAGWYEPGPMPGEAGPAVVAAHVDSRRGPDVFYRLRELQAGDEIRLVGSNGVVIVYAVEALEQRPKSELPVDRIWNQTDRPVVRLITCGGSFDYSTRHYRDNIIVYGSFLRTGT